jgi:16S rRNA (cytosine1402-N4)-methyltransferase
VFRAYGEEPRAVSIARAIERQRPVETTSKLAEIIRKQVHPPHESKTLARVFQAIRIAVNDELDVLETALNGAATMLRTGGRLVAISYHSLEDRRVKRFLRSGNFEGRIERDLYGNRSVPFRELTRKPVSASPEEQQDNPRARSARLRIGERIREPLDLQRSSDT